MTVWRATITPISDGTQHHRESLLASSWPSRVLSPGTKPLIISVQRTLDEQDRIPTNVVRVFPDRQEHEHGKVAEQGKLGTADAMQVSLFFQS